MLLSTTYILYMGYIYLREEGIVVILKGPVAISKSSLHYFATRKQKVAEVSFLASLEGTPVVRSVFVIKFWIITLMGALIKYTLNI